MKTIKNPVTGKEYKVKEHSSKYDPNKKIEGLWSKDMKEFKKDVNCLICGKKLPDVHGFGNRPYGLLCKNCFTEGKNSLSWWSKINEDDYKEVETSEEIYTNCKWCGNTMLHTMKYDFKYNNITFICQACGKEGIEPLSDYEGVLE